MIGRRRNPEPPVAARHRAGRDHGVADPRSRMRISVTIAILISAASVGHSAWAQSTAAPTTVEPDKVEKRIDAPRTTRPAQKQPASPAAPTTAPTTPPAGRFVLGAVEISGTSAYPAGTFAEVYEPHLAREVSVEDVRAMAMAITDRYRRDGYFLSRAVVEPQDLALGILHIRVVEGVLAEVAFDGDVKHQRADLEALAKGITRSTPTQIGDVERYVLLMNDLPGVTVKSAVKAIDEEKGQYRLVIGVDFKRRESYASLDNRGTRAIGHFQALVGSNFNALVSGDDQTRVTLFTVPNQPQELLFGELSHSRNIGDEGTRVRATVSHSEIDAGTPFAKINLGSRSTHASIRVYHPVVRRQRRNLWIHGQFDFINQRQDQLDVRTFDDRLRVVRWGANYDLEDDLDGYNTGGVEVSHGVDILGATGEDSADASRTGGQASFTKYTARLGRRQVISDTWAVEAHVAGQKSNVRLLSAEEFFLGGVGFGRAYDSGELAGGDGAAGSVELQYGRFISWPWLNSYQVYGFYDWGIVWDSVNSDFVGHETLASAGGGIRLGFTDALFGGVEVAKPLTRPVANINDKATDPRVFFYLTGDF